MDGRYVDVAHVMITAQDGNEDYTVHEVFQVPKNFQCTLFTISSIHYCAPISTWLDAAHPQCESFTCYKRQDRHPRLETQDFSKQLHHYLSVDVSSHLANDLLHCADYVLYFHLLSSIHLHIWSAHRICRHVHWTSIHMHVSPFDYAYVGALAEC